MDGWNVRKLWVFVCRQRLALRGREGERERAIKCKGGGGGSESDNMSDKKRLMSKWA